MLPVGDVLITEVSLVNVNGQAGPYVELTNTTDRTVSLNGLLMY